MTFEQRVELALHVADTFEPSPDLFANVQRSIEEDAAHRRRVQRVVTVILAAAVGVGVYLWAVIDVVDGQWTMPYPALEWMITAVMVALVAVLGPMIRRFGQTYEQAVFAGSPNTGQHVLKLLDVAYYLIFGAYILVTMTFEPGGDIGETLGEWVQWSQIRVGGLLVLMGLLHVVMVVSLPVVGLVHATNLRRIRINRGTISTDLFLDKVDTAITVGVWIVAVLWLLQFVPLLIGGLAGLAGA